MVVINSIFPLEVMEITCAIPVTIPLAMLVTIDNPTKIPMIARTLCFLATEAPNTTALIGVMMPWTHIMTTDNNPVMI